MGAIVDRGAVGALAEDLRRQGRKIVLTNGCFDLLHLGHLRYLEAARAMGDVLLVGINVDEQVQRLKGPERPFVPEAERAELVAGLIPVDYAFLFAEPTAAELLAEIRPEVYAKGGDYQAETLPEAAVASACGAKIVFLPTVPGHSTTNLAAAVAANRGRDSAKKG